MRINTQSIIALVLFTIFSFCSSVVVGAQEEEYDYIITVKREVHRSTTGEDGQDPIVTKLKDGRGVVALGETMPRQKCGGCTVQLQKVENGIATLYFTNSAGSCNNANQVVEMDGTFEVVVGTSVLDAPQEQWQDCSNLDGYVWFGIEQRNITRFGGDKDEDDGSFVMEEEEEPQSSARKSTFSGGSASFVMMMFAILIGLNFGVMN